MAKERTKEGPTRPYAPADREAASALIGDIRPLSQPGCHAHVWGGEGVVDGVALWMEPPPGLDEAYLGPVVATGVISHGERFYELVLACATDALDRGYERGYFTIKDRALWRTLTIMFRIEPVPTGWETEGVQPREWEVHVELPDAIEQLRHILALFQVRSA